MSKTHDYTKRYWGHDYTITKVRNDGVDISMSGWGRGIAEGDYMLIESQSSEPGANSSTRYRVKSVRYCENPRDMWHMECVFAPRQRKEEVMR